MKATRFLVASIGLVLFAVLLVQSPRMLWTKESSTAEAHSSDAAARAVESRSAKLSSPTKQQITTSYGRLPLSFEANRGQTDSRVKFLSRGSGYSLFLTGTETVLTFVGAGASPPGSRAEFRRPSAKEQEQGSRTPP